MTEANLESIELVMNYEEEKEVKKGVTNRPLHPSLTDFELSRQGEKSSLGGGGGGVEESLKFDQTKLWSHLTTTLNPVDTLSHLRPTFTTLPTTTNTSTSTSTSTSLPLGLVTTPLLSPLNQEIPVITSPPLRCQTCRAYLSPHVTLLPHLDRWRCALCHELNSIPSYHPLSNPSDPSTDRITAIERLPEFQTNTVDYLASTKLDSTPPTYLFLIELTDLSLENGVTKSCLQALRTALDQLATSSRPDRPTRVGFVTVSPHELHCYRFRGDIREPELLVVRDLDNDEEEGDLPHPELLAELREVRIQVDAFLRRSSGRVKSEDLLPKGGDEKPFALGSALRLAKRILTRAGHGGQILLFHKSSPNHSTSHRTKLSGLKSDQSWYRVTSGGVGQGYKNFALECNQSRIAISLFSFGTGDLALPLLMALPRFTGGQLHHYPDFSSTIPQQFEKLESELTDYLATDFLRDVTAVLRCHPSLHLTHYYGHQYLLTPQTISLPFTTSHQLCSTVGFTIDKKLTDPTVGFQSTVAYTDHHGQKYVRVTTILIPTTADPADCHRSIDPVAMVTFLTKRAVDQSLTSSTPNDLTSIRQTLTDLIPTLPHSFNPLVQTILHHVTLHPNPTLPPDCQLTTKYTLLAATPLDLLHQLGLTLPLPPS